MLRQIANLGFKQHFPHLWRKMKAERRLTSYNSRSLQARKYPWKINRLSPRQQAVRQTLVKTYFAAKSQQNFKNGCSMKIDWIKLLFWIAMGALDCYLMWLIFHFLFTIIFK